MTSASAVFADLLELDAERELERITTSLRESVTSLRRRGVVVGVSGGIDSSVVLALSVRAFGAENVFAVLSPEQDSAPETLELSRLAVSSSGVESIVEDISPVLDAFGCYRRRDEITSSLIPGYGEGWKMKIVLPPILAE